MRGVFGERLLSTEHNFFDLISEACHVFLLL